MIDTLTVLRGQHLICATAETNTQSQSQTWPKHTHINISLDICTETEHIKHIQKIPTYFKTRVSSLIACTATSYSLSSVMETIRSYKRQMKEWMTFRVTNDILRVQSTMSDQAASCCSVRVRSDEVWAVVSTMSSRWCWPWSDWWRVPILHWAPCCSTDPAELSGTSDVPLLARTEN